MVNIFNKTVGIIASVIAITATIYLLIFNVVRIYRGFGVMIERVRAIRDKNKRERNIKKGRKEKIDLKIHIKKICLRKLHKLKVYFSEKTNERLIKTIVVSLMMTVLIGEKIINILPEGMKNVYFFLVMGLFALSFVYVFNSRTIMGNLLSIRSLVFYGVGIVLFMQIGFMEVILNMAFKETIKFSSVLGVIIILLPLVISMLSSYLKYANVNLLDLIAVIVSFYIFELYIVLLFGIYNLSLQRDLFMNLEVSSSGDLIAKLIQSGFVHMLKTPELGERTEYLIQYIIGNIMHVVLLGFIISFASGFIKKDEDTEKEAA